MMVAFEFSFLEKFVCSIDCWFIGGDGVVTGGPLAWGLCFNKEMSPSQDYCNDYFKLTYPCAPGAQYYGRGALPIYWFEVFYRRFLFQWILFS